MYALTHTSSCTHVYNVQTHTCAHSPGYERVCDGYGDISSHVQSHNVTRNTRTHQSFSRKWNLLPSSRRISAPCTQYFARPRARPLYGGAARMSSLICAGMTRRIFHQTKTKEGKGERERGRERRKQHFGNAVTLLDIRYPINGHSL